MFQLFIILMIVAFVLLLWPQRGLSVRNCVLSFVSILVVSVVGVLTLIIFFHDAGIGLFLVAATYLFLFFLSFILASFAVFKFGNKGITLIKPKSILALHPWRMLRNFTLASLVAFLLAAYLSTYLEMNHYTLFTYPIVLPVSFLLSVVWSGRLEVLKPITALKTSLTGSVAVLFCSFILGPYFILGLPLVVYSFVASFVFLQLAYKKQEFDLQ